MKEKYVFGLLFCGGIWTLSVLISLIYVWITKEIPIDDALMVNYAVSIILVLVFMGISIPVQLKYGKKKEGWQLLHRSWRICSDCRWNSAWKSF